MSPSDERREAKLPAGTMRYQEAGEGKPVVFVHGYLVDGRLWDGVVDALRDRCRCIAPDWPMGAHRIALKPGADLSPPTSRGSWPTRSQPSPGRARGAMEREKLRVVQAPLKERYKGSLVASIGNAVSAWSNSCELHFV